MDIFKSFATDEVAETEGRWFPISKTAKVLVARAGNPNYLKALRQRMRESQVDVDDTSEENEKFVTSLIVETLAETVLLGWKGDIQFKGKPLEYSKANAIKLLEFKDFRKKITEIADKSESFRLKEDEAQGKD